MAALDAYMESVRHLRSILARLERHGAHPEASQLATIVCRHPLFCTRYVSHGFERIILLMAVRVLLRADALVVRGVCGTAAAIRLPQFRV